MDLYVGFSDAALQVVELAREESTRFNHNYIGTEHLLLGLLLYRPSAASLALSNMGVELDRIRSAIEFIIGRGGLFVLGAAGLTPRGKHVIELSRDEARRLRSDEICPEHLLLGLVREGEGIAAGVLESLGVTLEKARAEVIHQITHPGAHRFIPLSGALTLVCRDVAATADFYMDFLDAREATNPGRGWQVAADGERPMRLPDGGPLLVLRAASHGAEDVSGGDADGIELNFFARDVVKLWVKLQARDAPRLSPVNAVAGAGDARTFTLTDPDGRRLRYFGFVESSADDHAV